MTRRNGQDALRGFTLLEAMLSIAIGALILASLTVTFKVGKQNWNINSVRSELVQHARIGMSRLTTELRYATQLNQGDTTAIEFDTTVLLDNDDATVETVRYEITGGVLKRTAGGVQKTVAGDTVKGIAISFAAVDPVKLDAADNVVPLDVADPLSMAIGVAVTMTVNQPAGNQALSLKTLVKFRG